MDFNIILLPIGITEGMVMFLLSMQTGLIDMKLPQRLGAMSIILFIVAASLFQTILEITHPVLLALSASSRNIWSHIKVNKFVIPIFKPTDIKPHAVRDTMLVISV